MEAKELLRVLHTAERLKDETRHCYTSGGRHESVAEHSWRLALTALFLRDEFPALDMDRVIRMCLIHDLGECFTGDIPSFLKSGGDEERERSALETWVASLPAPYSVELKTLYAEMDALETDEARLYKALDKLEAVIQHNESDIATWLPREYELNLTYADENVAFSDYLKRLREEIRRETRNKIAAAEHNRQ
ncbi:MAG: HD domain-containing protein [Oscillospiraceae bacterium]|nr:HD domain-containing protein [Oscillospiraceae bacterium]MDY5805918.1 HD domain-containing protein [Oscillospiraceae bacterium]